MATKPIQPEEVNKVLKLYREYANSVSSHLARNVRNWYEDQYTFVSRVFADRLLPMPPLQREHFMTICMGMLAATSTNASLAANWRLFLGAVDALLEDTDMPPMLPAVRDKCEALRELWHTGNVDERQVEWILSGLKIKAYFLALNGNPEAVVVDRWMLRAAGLTERLTPRRLRLVELAIEELAAELQTSARSAQARVWAGIRDTMSAGVDYTYADVAEAEEE